MELLMNLMLFFILMFVILRVLFPFVVVGIVLNDAMQVSEQEYQEVAALLKKHPKLKHAVDKAMADRVITKAEFADLHSEVVRLDLDKALEDAGTVDYR